MALITHIIFDNNGVLTTNDLENTYNVVSSYLGITIDKLISLFSIYVRDLDTGRITQRQFYSNILRDLNSSKEVRELEWIHLSAYIPKPQVQELAINLSKNYKISLLSNFGDAFWRMYPLWELDKIFSKEDVFVSADLGIAKPDKDIFNHILRKLNVKPENALFIDDNEQNISVAKSLGLNVILFKDLASASGQLKELGLNI